MCPDCESSRRRVRMTGVDSEGRKMRYGICLDCTRRYTTVEVTVPDPHSLFTLSALRKEQNRLSERQRRGYHGGIGGPPLKPEPVLRVTVSLAEKRRRHEKGRVA